MIGIENDTSYSADIEQEVNGLYSFERKEKLEAKKVKAVVDEVKQIYYRQQGLK